jgi:hypothetical protein
MHDLAPCLDGGVMDRPKERASVRIKGRGSGTAKAQMREMKNPGSSVAQPAKYSERIFDGRASASC